jgi:outer membrane protein, multidrug efflux system
MRLTVRLLRALLLPLALSGCMIGPDYVRPAVDVPAAWRIDVSDARDLSGTAWWEQFQDPVLNDLITSALAQNQDVRIAAARIEEYRGKLAVTQSQLFPQVGANVDAARQRASHQNGFITYPDSTNTTYNSYQALVSASWEIDLWGQLRRATEAARDDLLATTEAKRAVVLSLVASVAGNYILLRDLDRQLEISRQTATSRGESLHVFELRFKGGVISELELAQNQSQYQDALASIPPLEEQIAATENLLSVLMGRNPGAIPRGRNIDELQSPQVPAGLPSALLDQRPDIRQAEEQLAAANARIGVAQAAYFPTISLSGALGSASAQLSSLFTGPTGVWAFGAGLVAPIFTAGAIAGNVQQAEAQQQEALFNYQRSILNAFADVDNALADHGTSLQRLTALRAEVEANSNYARLARLRYENGYTSYIEVLDAEQRLFSSQLALADQQAHVLNTAVNLYQAIGGGWVELADSKTTSSSDAGAAAGER